jgi:prepilin-type N-terminal cleavage/methylation domain-containing protein
MSQSLRHSAGFTIIELSLVLIVVGILASTLIPLFSDVHESSLRETDDTRMETIRNALMGYIRINEAVPCMAGGVQVENGCDPIETLDLLGVRTTDARGKAFVLDVNDDLTVAGLAASGNSICGALANIISPPPPPAPAPTLNPQVCDAANANTGNTACAAAHSMAFVLVGRSSDRCLNLENTHTTSPNDAVCTTAVANNRTFENPARLRSRESDDAYYDDLILTATPTELAEALGCPAGGGGGSAYSVCPANEVLAQVSNGDNSAMSIGVSGSCFVISEGTTASMGCQPEATTITVYANQSCTSTIVTNTLDALDTNDDNRADIVCDNTNACSWR